MLATLALPGARQDVVREWGPVVLIWSCLLLLPFSRSVEAPVLVMAAAGILVAVRQRTALLRLAGMRLFLAVFAAMWIPVLLSLPDAVNAERSLVVTVNHLRFALSGVFIVWALSRPRAPRLLLTLSAALLAFWVFDSLVQLFFGTDLIGRMPTGQRLSGPFGAESTKLGTTLGVLAPLLWACVQHRLPPWAVWAAVGLTVFVVLAAGARAGWVSVGVSAAGFAWINRRALWRHRARALGALGLLALLLPPVAYVGVPAVKQRVDQSISELSGREPTLTSPLGHRAWIWKGAAAMIADNPINGVGARGFRYAFPDYAAPGDPFVEQARPILPTHSHQVLLEIAAETGLVGIAGLLLAAWLIAGALRSAGAGAREAMAPYAIALGAAFFPLNTHLAIYSAHWSQLVWWLIAVCCGCLGAGPRAGDGGLRPAPGGEANDS